MGIFGNKQQPDPMQSDDLVSDMPVDDAFSSPGSLDGILPGGQPQSDPLSTTAPLVDDHVHDDDDGGYIMADPPAKAEDEEAYRPVIDVNAPELAKHAVTDIPEEIEKPTEESRRQDAGSSSPSLEDLSIIKQEALKQLSPLVDHLKQTPEEKFQTTMMMLQATDDHSLVKAAYDAAQAITDEKARAQALLEIVNEINYFTQHKS